MPGKSASGNRVNRLLSFWREYRPFCWALIAIIALWFIVPGAIILWIGKPAHAGELGDVFGSINALFAGLAFFGVIVTIYLQHQELKQNTQELRNQANALGKQVELMAASARLSALPLLIRQEKERIWTIAPEWRTDFKDEDFAPEDLDDLAQTLTEGIESDGRKIEARQREAGVSISEDHLLNQRRARVKRHERIGPHLKKLRALKVELDKLASSVREMADSGAGTGRAPL